MRSPYTCFSASGFFCSARHLQAHPSCYEIFDELLEVASTRPFYPSRWPSLASSSPKGLSRDEGYWELDTLPFLPGLLSKGSQQTEQHPGHTLLQSGQRAYQTWEASTRTARHLQTVPPRFKTMLEGASNVSCFPLLWRFPKDRFTLLGEFNPLMLS